MTLTCSRSKAPICIQHTPKRPKFSSFSLYSEPFSSYTPFFGKVHRMTSNYLDIFQVKNTICMLRRPRRPDFGRFTLRYPFLSYEPNFVKSVPNDCKMTLTCSRLQVLICILHTDTRHKFLSFSSTMSRFRVTAQYWE